VPAASLAVFDPSELELLIGGISVIDVNDWRVNTDYREYSAASAVRLGVGVGSLDTSLHGVPLLSPSSGFGKPSIRWARSKKRACSSLLPVSQCIGSI
jgi:hypothetical protein